MSSNATERFTHHVTSAGPARGMRFTGLRRVGGTPDKDVPLVVAIHGGGYTSSYFDVPGYSLLDRAAGLDVPIIAVDRPGHGGSSPAAAGESLYLANAAALDHLISELWESTGIGCAGVFLIGHSIGVHVAMGIAARKPQWPLLGLALSGCLLRHADGFTEVWAAHPETFLDVPVEQKAELMFGPAWTHRSDMPQTSYFANVPVRTAELVEGAKWVEVFGDLAPEISVPVQLRHGQLDRLWAGGQDQIAEFAAGLTSSPYVDVEVVPAAGHAIDYHRVGAAFQTQQLAFALNCSIRGLDDI
ncbi:alpha/beta fold hydrolase [Lentzea jiangxiensis]|uniref:Pimeloyl-ACP methyl ester carboxylesterase n=1 Tax=Lentzea jiangxiensis TaxID=641025 RepID=A0A1H0WYT3_9PSEU|nr:alpha/beta hydrolase [Lentzea jiangxiensis]SDP95605.1 Pimeloyl-ACP methyl ester carboxylesterase [Lentzea jiangxiensis]